MSTNDPNRKIPLVLTERELWLIVSWWSWAYGEGATSPEDDALSARLSPLAGIGSPDVVHS